LVVAVEELVEAVVLVHTEPERLLLEHTQFLQPFKLVQVVFLWFHPELANLPQQMEVVLILEHQ
jgi:hypothetical protein